MPLTFPSESFPAYPSLQIDQPDGWVGLAGVGLPLALAAEVPAGQFRPNVLVTVTRFGVGHTVAASRAEVNKSLKALPRFTQTLREDSIEMLGSPGMRVEGYFSDGKGGTLVQALRMCVMTAGPVFDVVQVTGTCTGPQTEAFFGQIRDIQDSLRLLGGTDEA